MERLILTTALVKKDFVNQRFPYFSTK